MATSLDIKRKAELFLCEMLTHAVPSISFYPSKGGAASTDMPDVILPPYCVIEAQSSEKMMATQNVWTIPVIVCYVTAISDTDPTTHAQNVQAIYDALAAIIPGLLDPDLEILVHGMDISSTDQVEDEGNHAHGDVINVIVAASDARDNVPAVTIPPNLITPAGSVTPIVINVIPTGEFDFSMFYNGVAPSTGTYMAISQTNAWIFVAGWDRWRISPITDPSSPGVMIAS